LAGFEGCPFLLLYSNLSKEGTGQSLIGHELFLSKKKLISNSQKGKLTIYKDNNAGLDILSMPLTQAPRFLQKAGRPFQCI
jgi:hypothetical protein